MSRSKPAAPTTPLAVVDWAGVRLQRVEYEAGTTIFAQGDPASSVMYVSDGTVRLSVVSHTGKEAVIAVLDGNHFFGEGCLVGQPLRMATASAMAGSTIIVVERPEMVRQLHAQPAFADRFLTHMLTRNIRIEEEKVSQETLADMVGTTRSRVNFFMNKFRKLGFIEYNGGLKINNSLLSVVLRD